MNNCFKFALLFLPFFGISQVKNDSISLVNKLKEVVVSSKLPNDRSRLSNQLVAISSKQIDFQNFQTTADVLANSGTLFVQKSQQGGGSPVIRGFEASRVLLVVDGVRMNNLIFRSGHLQNVITIDESLLDNVEIFYGPTSTLFGSDALGGAVVMTTKRAQFLDETKKKFTGGISTRYSSVNQEKSVALNLNYATNRFATLSILSFNDFGDLKMGKKENYKGSYFGEQNQYVATINGVDQLLTNDDKYTQLGSGYKQYNFLQKFSYKSAAGFLHSLNAQYTTSSTINRYDRLSETTSTGLKHAEWYYGPQQRFLGVYNLQKGLAFLDSNLNVNLSYQKVKESRHNRRFENYNLQNRTENVAIYALGFDLTKKFKNADLYYGFESYFENLKSTANTLNVNTNAFGNLDSRYPNGQNNMFRNDFYVSYNQKLDAQTFWNTGARLGYTLLRSTIADNSFFELPFTSISQNNITYSGNLGVTHNTSKNFTLKLNVASGFRVPNIDDLAKIFESVAGTASQPGLLIVPNADLKPERTLTIDLSFVLQSDSQKIKFENTYFYTRLYDAIVTSEFLYNGQSSVLYNGYMSQVFANQNTGKAFITGLSSSLFVELVRNLNFNANFNYTLGRVVEDGSQTPLDHISPFFGKIGLAYNKKWVSLEGYLLYNGKKYAKDYSTSGEDNAQYAPVGGMPAWETYNFKAGIQVFNGATLYLGIENILDTQYRTFSSGINAPGRNCYGGLKYGF
jgi:hemoglobin/transferrin/lactoferrin receptor protein